MSGEKAALRSGVAKGQDQERATHAFLLCCIQRENCSLDDYGPKLFCVASDLPVCWPPGKTLQFSFRYGLFFLLSVAAYQNRTFRESIFLRVFEIQEHSHEEITATAADVVVERCFLVLPETLKQRDEEQNGSICSCWELYSSASW